MLQLSKEKEVDVFLTPSATVPSSSRIVCKADSGRHLQLPLSPLLKFFHLPSFLLLQREKQLQLSDERMNPAVDRLLE